MIIDKGHRRETLSERKMRGRLGPGSVIFNASNAPHARYATSAITPAYHVINWKTAATPTR